MGFFKPVRKKRERR